MACKYVHVAARWDGPVEDDDSSNEEEDTELDDEDDSGSDYQLVGLPLVRWCT